VVFEHVVKVFLFNKEKNVTSFSPFLFPSFFFFFFGSPPPDLRTQTPEEIHKKSGSKNKRKAVHCRRIREEMTSSFAMMINTTKVRPRVFLLLFFSFVVVGFRARGKERTFALEGDWTRMDFYASSFYAKV